MKGTAHALDPGVVRSDAWSPEETASILAGVEARNWLAEALKTLHPGHAWLGDLEVART